MKEIEKIGTHYTTNCILFETTYSPWYRLSLGYLYMFFLEAYYPSVKTFFDCYV